MKKFLFHIPAFFSILTLAHASECPSDFGTCSNTLIVSSESLIGSGPLNELMRKSEYEKLIRIAKTRIESDQNDEEAFSMMGEAVYRLAEIQSGNKDSNEVPKIFIDDAGESDPIGYRLYQIGLRIGPNYWSESVIEKYSEFLDCSIDKYLVYRPNFRGYISRKLSIKISSRKFDDATKIMKSQNNIEGNNPSEFYPELVERFVGVNDEANGALWLREVEKTHGIKGKVKNYWKKILERHIKDRQDLTESQKTALKQKVRHILLQK